MPAADSLLAVLPDRARLYRAMERLLIVYLIAIVAVMWIRGNRVTPDLFFVFAGIAALLLGRGKAFIRDWFPLVAIFLAWQASRGIAWQAGFTVQSDSLIAIERALAFGIVPTEFLQATLRGGGISGLDVALTLVYHSHFILPLTLGFALWLRHRPMFHRYMAVLLLVSIAQFVTTLLLPAAPPRYAYYYGQEALAVVDVGRVVKDALGWGEASWAYQNMNANPVAAFPSLHAAYPVIAWLAIRRTWPRWRNLAVLYIAVVWFTIVYLGHHYLIDAYGGAIYAVLGWLAVRRWFAVRSERRASREPDRQTAPALVPIPVGGGRLLRPLRQVQRQIPVRQPAAVGERLQVRAEVLGEDRPE